MSRKAQYDVALRGMDQPDGEDLPANGSGDKEDVAIGIYGWRKRFLYCCVLLLVIVIIVNLALTIWMLVILEFSYNGPGKLNFIDSGIQIEGDAQFLGELEVSSILSAQGSNLLLRSQKQVSIEVGSLSQFEVGEDSVNVTSQQFSVRSPTQIQSEPDLLSVYNNEVKVGADTLDVTGGRGMTVNKLETSAISSLASNDLQLSAPSGQVEIFGAQGLMIGSSVGSVDLRANGDLEITSQTISLDGDVYVTGLLLKDGRQPEPNESYQVCICSNGKLYLADSAGNCNLSITSSICT